MKELYDLELGDLLRPWVIYLFYVEVHSIDSDHLSDGQPCHAENNLDWKLLAILYLDLIFNWQSEP